MGSEIAAQVYEQAFDYLDAPVGRVAAVEVPMPYSKALEHLVVPDENRIISATKTVLNNVK
jgi:pyruvate dehydrogenase E1 component beta subunit